MIDFTFKTEEKAIEALESSICYDFIKNHNSIRYLAVVKEDSNSFKIEIGKKENTQEDLYKKLINLLIQRSDSLPSSDFKNFCLNCRDHSLEDIKLLFKLKNVERFTSEYSTQNDRPFSFSKELKGGISISHENSGSVGTLGGLFKLNDYPNTLFGITNWHVASGAGIDLGKKIIHPAFSTFNSSKSVPNYICGQLSWHCLDDYREAAIIQFYDLKETQFEKTSSTNTCGYAIKSIEKPSFDSKVKICGYKSGCNKNDNECTPYSIHSTNATIKVHNSNYGNASNGYNDTILFKKQILVKDISTDGDSGSLLVNEQNNAIGLIFAKTTTVKNIANICVANNINTIFNSTIIFPDTYSQIKIHQNTGYTKKLLLEKFI
ncbi:hypothetical protein [Aquimarina rhabdastrellae]